MDTVCQLPLLPAGRPGEGWRPESRHVLYASELCQGMEAAQPLDGHGAQLQVTPSLLSPLSLRALAVQWRKWTTP